MRSRLTLMSCIALIALGTGHYVRAQPASDAHLHDGRTNRVLFPQAIAVVDRHDVAHKPAHSPLDWKTACAFGVDAR